MRVFEDVKMTWRGKEVVLPADVMLRTIAQVEDILSIGKLYDAMFKKSLPLAKVAMCYGVMLRAADVDVTDDEVYAGLFEDSGRSIQSRALQAIATLQALMIPPKSIREAGGATEKGGEAAEKAGAPSPSASSSPSGRDG